MFFFSIAVKVDVNRGMMFSGSVCQTHKCHVSEITGAGIFSNFGRKYPLGLKDKGLLLLA